MMGIIKAKNTAGEWVNVSTAEMIMKDKDLNMVQIQPFPNSPITSNRSAFDLSPYVNPTDNFILFFTTGSGVGGGNSCIPLVYIKSDGQLRRLHDNVTAQMPSLNNLFPLSNQCKVSYDEETRIFDVVMQESSDQVNNYAWLFYPAIKEA